MKISRRNFLAVAGAAAAAAALTACGGSSASSTSTASSAAASTASSAAEGGEKIVKVALTCDTGTIDDESFNQACWAAVSSYMGKNCQYYIPESDASDEDRETMIRLAVNEGADVIVCVGYLYGASLAWAAEQYPNIKFIAIDVTQGDIGTDSIPANCYCITFKEEQAGYLAGYGGIYTSAVEAALKNNGYVVGVDVDQNYIGVNGVAKDGYAYNPFVTSAMKGLSESVSTALGNIEAGEWSNIAATNGNFGLEDGDYVGLPTADDSWNFKTFTKDEYETLKSKIASGELVVDNSSDDATKPTVSEFTKVNYIQ